MITAEPTEVGVPTPPEPFSLSSSVAFSHPYHIPHSL